MVIATTKQYKAALKWLETAIFSKDTSDEQWNKLSEVLGAVEKFEKESPMKRDYKTHP